MDNKNQTATGALNCSSFHPYHSRSTLFFAVNVVLVGLLCGIGIIGNLFNIVVLSRRNYSKQSVIFIFLTALATADMLTLAMYLPNSLSNADVFKSEINYSIYMAYFHIVHYGLSNICKHSAIWFIVFVAILRHMAICYVFKRRWSRQYQGTTIVCVLVVGATILNLPRFFELEIVKIFCEPNETLYAWHFSEFSKTYWYGTIYPWISATLGYIIPLFLVLVFNILIIIKVRVSRFSRRQLAPGSPNLNRQPDRQTTKMLVVVMLLFFLLELPDAAAHIHWAIRSHHVRYQVQYHEFILIANLLSLIHSSITFILYSVMSSEFRKTFHQTFCPCDKKKERKHKESVSKYSTFIFDHNKRPEASFCEAREAPPTGSMAESNSSDDPRNVYTEMIVIQHDRQRDNQSMSSLDSSNKGTVWI